MVIFKKVVLYESEFENIDQVEMMIEMADYAMHHIMANLHNYSVIRKDEADIEFLRIQNIVFFCQRFSNGNLECVHFPMWAFENLKKESPKAEQYMIIFQDVVLTPQKRVNNPFLKHKVEVALFFISKTTELLKETVGYRVDLRKGKHYVQKA